MRKIHDRYFRQAKREGHLARSFYKLEEMDRRLKLFRPGQRVLDVGACPGSWLEYILERIGPAGVACAVDLNVIDKRFKGLVHFKKMDVRTLAPEDFAEVAPTFHAVVSDMAPKTSGIKSADQARSLELCEAVWGVAQTRLEPGGAFLCKVLEGPDFDHFRESLRPRFASLRTIKPKASRDESMETYLAALGFGKAPEARRDRPDHESRKTKGKRTRPY